MDGGKGKLRWRTWFDQSWISLGSPHKYMLSTMYKYITPGAVYDPTWDSLGNLTVNACDWKDDEGRVGIFIKLLAPFLPYDRKAPPSSAPPERDQTRNGGGPLRS